MSDASPPKRRKGINWAPYLLILPTLIYLLLFFGYPMVRGLLLAVQDEGARLAVLSVTADGRRLDTGNAHPCARAG